ncbi:hypothetical protein NLU13_2560 [Sarocladium strictum]|uniref:Uncharacterized protein n=1 Tax=Sarocladium strictum TaxID=5046 RepID=A0AA39L9G4_SARSR|nr:hypothetical protein NLU13_2560 [Sarocladium strictum]
MMLVVAVLSTQTQGSSHLPRCCLTKRLAVGRNLTACQFKPKRAYSFTRRQRTHFTSSDDHKAWRRQGRAQNPGTALALSAGASSIPPCVRLLHASVVNWVAVLPSLPHARPGALLFSRRPKHCPEEDAKSEVGLYCI